MYFYGIIIIFVLVLAITIVIDYYHGTKSIEEQLTRMRNIHKCPCRNEVQLAINWLIANWNFDDSKTSVPSLPIVEHTMLWLTVLTQFKPELIPADIISFTVIPKSVTNNAILCEVFNYKIYLLEKYSLIKLFKSLQLGEISETDFAESLLPLFLCVVAGDYALLTEIKRGVMRTIKLSAETKNMIYQCIHTLDTEISSPKISCNCC